MKGPQVLPGRREKKAPLAFQASLVIMVFRVTLASPG